MKIVLDTNVLISGVFWKGTARKVLDYWIEEHFEVFITQRILDEYLRILNKYDKDGHIAESWATLIAEYSILIPDKKKFHICRDKDDNKFLDCAAIGRTNFIVSGDKDLLDLKEVMSIPIIKPANFCKIIEQHL